MTVWWSKLGVTGPTWCNKAGPGAFNFIVTKRARTKFRPKTFDFYLVSRGGVAMKHCASKTLAPAVTILP
jgi:hypothetical protein